MGRKILVFLLFIFMPIYAWAAGDSASNIACSTHNSSQVDCQNSPGCKWVPQTGAGDSTVPAHCESCPSGYFGDCSETNGKCENVNSDYTKSHIYGGDNTQNRRGARTIYECYKDVQCTKSDGTNSSSGTPSECREYYRTSGSFISCKNSDNTWDTGTDSDDGDVDNSIQSSYHYENTNQCYANDIKCKWILQACNDSKWSRVDNGTLAHYTNNNWDISQCMYYSKSTYGAANNNIQAPFIGHVDDGTQNGKDIYCYAKVHRYPAEEQYGTVADVQARSCGSEQLGTYCTSFDQGCGGAIKKFDCIGCKAGYYPVRDQNLYLNHITETAFDACKITPTGYYSNACSNYASSSNDNSYFVACSNASDCLCGQISNEEDIVRKPCPAGMTSAAGATSIAGCHYTAGADGTQFCDAYGCFTLSSLTGWTFYHSPRGTVSY